MSTARTDELHVVPITAVKALVDDLAELGIDTLHLHVDGQTPGDRRPDVRLWLRTRTDFERVCTRWALKATERRYNQPGQRSWSAEKDTDEARLLVQCVSFEHHPDWQPKDTSDQGSRQDAGAEGEL